MFVNTTVALCSRIPKEDLQVKNSLIFFEEMDLSVNYNKNVRAQRRSPNFVSLLSIHVYYWILSYVVVKGLQNKTQSQGIFTSNEAGM